MDNKTLEPLQKIPAHIAIIMDGNGRWALERGLPRLSGHKAGTENLREVIEACAEFGIKYLTIYAFSTENWNRPEEEIQGLMGIFRTMLDRELNNLHKNGVQLRHIGRLDGIDKRLQQKIQEAIKLTQGNQTLILNVAFNYGGRDEILQAIKEIVLNGENIEDLDDNLFSKYLFTAGSPDPDLIIRTSGEFRISNFLIWQGAYAEWYFTPTYWPDFNKEELYQALLAYNERDRRYGKVKQAKGK
ncbi:MAG: isoprenyl transferase [Anaerolineales bacterium]|jgi:undecaprenyl diphosphate synthase